MSEISITLLATSNAEGKDWLQTTTWSFSSFFSNLLQPKPFRAWEHDQQKYQPTQINPTHTHTPPKKKNKQPTPKWNQHFFTVFKLPTYISVFCNSFFTSHLFEKAIDEEKKACSSVLLEVMDILYNAHHVSAYNNMRYLYLYAWLK